ncbi:recombination mediator protein UvsY, partial [Enterococcus faecalis]
KGATSWQYGGILIDFCRGALAAHTSRGFAIKHIQDMRAFEAGK